MTKERLSVITTIRLTPAERVALDYAAAKDRRSASALIRKILSEWLRKQSQGGKRA